MTTEAGKWLQEKEATQALGRYLRELREKKRKVSLHDVERATGISNGYLSLLERGKKQHLPPPDVLGKLADYYNASMQELLQHAGYLKSTDVKNTMEDRIERAFHHVINDPKYLAGIQLRGSRISTEVKRFVVELYEQATGRHLIPKELPPDMRSRKKLWERLFEEEKIRWRVVDVRRSVGFTDYKSAALSARGQGDKLIQYDCKVKFEKMAEASAIMAELTKKGTAEKLRNKTAVGEGYYRYLAQDRPDETWLLDQAIDRAKVDAYKKLSGVTLK